MSAPDTNADGNPRRLMHRRSVECLGYLRDDGLWEVEARLVDTKTYARQDKHRGLQQPLEADEIIESCPYNIPRKGPDGSLAKCDMCIDRVSNGLKPACVHTCPTGTMNFGDYKEMREYARWRVAEVKHRFPQATLLNPDTLRVIYLTAFKPNLYWEYAVASEREIDITRAVAVQRMLSPLRSFFSQLG